MVLACPDLGCPTLSLRKSAGRGMNMTNNGLKRPESELENELAQLRQENEALRKQLSRYPDETTTAAPPLEPALPATPLLNDKDKLELYRRVYLASNDGIVITDRFGNLIECNPSHQRHVGLRLEEIQNHKIENFIHPEDAMRIREAITANQQFRGEIKMKNTTSDTIYVDLSISAIYNDENELVNFVGIGRDITENKRSREVLVKRIRYEKEIANCSSALLENVEPEKVLPRALLHLLAASGTDRVYIFENFEDPTDGLCARQRFEVCASNVHSEQKNSLLQKLSYDKLLSSWREMLASNKPYGGLTRNLPLPIQAILQPQGVVAILILPVFVNKDWYGFIGFEDVTREREWREEEIRLLCTAADMIGGYYARWQAQEALRASEARFRKLVENSNNVIFALNPHGELTYLSPKFEKNSGFPDDEFLGKPVQSIIFTDDVPIFEQWLYESVILGDDQQIGFPTRFLTKDNQLRWFVTNASVIRDKAGQPLEIIGVAHDITEMKRVLDELEQTNQNLLATQAQLVQSEKMASLGMLVAGIAHEINTPIGSVNSMHDTLIRATSRLQKLLAGKCLHDSANLSKIDAMFQVISDANQVIQSGIKRVTTLVKRLRSFVRLDEAEIKIADLHEGLEDTLILIHHELKHHIQIVRDYGKIPPIACFLGRLNQIFVNILINAKQAITEKGTITIKTHYQCGKVFIHFTDTGSGIAKHNLQKIFDPGFTTKGVGVGTGLGLSICYQIIQEHHGEIQVKSELGQGTTFTLILPDNLAEILGIY